MRKTLEANMVMADLFPPGRVLWAVRDADLYLGHQLNPSINSSNARNGKKEGGDDSKVRLFEVLDVEKMFGQIIFARNMLR